MKIAYQGEPGAYSEQAVIEYFKVSVEPIPCDNFEQVFQLVESGENDGGMIPIENSLAGSIHQNYDNLLRHNLFINGEYYLRVSHCLIGFPDVKLEQVKFAHSHPQALGQCAENLRRFGIQPVPEYDTAGSVQIIKYLNDPSHAAIASKRAAAISGMKVIKDGLEDDQQNYTRFLYITKVETKTIEHAKTTIVFTLKNEPGALFKALSVFALRDIDLSKIESRPLQGTAWDYLFYIDLIGSVDDVAVRKAISHLEEYAETLRIFGSYPKAIR